MSGMHSKLGNGGFSLMEVSIALFIVAVLAGLLVPLTASLVDTQRSSQTTTDLQTMYTAIVGDPQKGTFGYLGDVGDYPATLTDLLSSSNTGWNGPYLTNARVDNALILDPFGGVVEYFEATTAGGADYLGLVSKGPDRSSTNPNQSSNAKNAFTAGTYPWLAGYAGSVSNVDNIVYPNFLDNAGLVAYQSVGTLSYNINNFDGNALVNASVPGCPGLYTITVTSVPRGTSDQFTLKYSPGGGSVDLVQGLYNVRISSPLTGSLLYQEQVSVFPGTTTSRTLNFGGLDSSVTTASANNLSVNNQLSATTIDVYRFTTKLTGAAGQGSGAASYTMLPCSQVIIRNHTGNAILDSFVMPNLSSTFTRLVNTNSSWTLTVTNTGTYPLLKVYEQGLLIGTVSYKGSRKSKKFFNVRFNDTITFESGSGAPIGASTFTMSNNDFTKTVP